MNKLIRISHHIRVKGFSNSLASLRQRFFPKPCGLWGQHAGLFAGKVALEIGDRSPSFCDGDVFPVYKVLARCDNLTSCANTEWTRGAPKVGGCSIIGCGVECKEIGASIYDAVISSHVLEHMANPIKALKNWHRITKPGGSMAIMLPCKEMTFDWRRPTTTFAHLIADFQTDVGEDDSTHVEEFNRLYDHRMNLVTQHTAMEIALLSSNPRKTGMIHHHTWDATLVCLALRYAGWEPVGIEYYPPFHIICVARRSP